MQDYPSGRKTLSAQRDPLQGLIDKYYLVEKNLWDSEQKGQGNDIYSVNIILEKLYTHIDESKWLKAMTAHLFCQAEVHHHLHPSRSHPIEYPYLPIPGLKNGTRIKHPCEYNRGGSHNILQTAPAERSRELAWLIPYQTTHREKHLLFIFTFDPSIAIQVRSGTEAWEQCTNYWSEAYKLHSNYEAGIELTFLHSFTGLVEWMTSLKTIGRENTPLSWRRQTVPEHEAITAANHNLDLYYSNDIIGFAWSTHEKPLARDRDRQKLQQALTKRIILFDSIYGTVPGIKAPKNKVVISDPNTSESNTEKIARSFWNNTIRTAYEAGASDIHIEPIASHTGNDCHLIVSLRLDDQARFHARIPSDLAPSFARYAVESSTIDPTNKTKIQAARRRWTHPETGDTISLRIQGTPAGTNLIRIVIRLLDTTKLKAGIGDLKLDSDELQIWHRALALQSGLVIISGPTGSGKSTTLYAALLSIYQRDNQRIFATMEDPVEYDLPFRATQTPVHKNEGPTYAEYIEANMRNDGDTFLVGEIRDPLTAIAALQLANTGHQVLTSIHANGAPETASRLIDLGVDKSLLSDTLKLVVSQKLIPAPCPRCKKSITSKEATALLRAMGGELIAHNKDSEWQDKYQRQPTWIVAPGCSGCDFTGIKGRCVAQEFLIIDNDNKGFLKDGNVPALRESMRIRKMPAMKEVAWRLAWQGKITIQQAGELTNQLEQN